MDAPRPASNDLDFTLHSNIPPHRRVTTGVYAAMIVFYVLVLTVLVREQRRLVRVGPGEATHTGIAAYVAGAVATTGTAPRPAVERPRKVSTATPAKLAAKSTTEPASAEEPSGSSGQQGNPSGPVPLGSGEGLTLLNKVTPVYPRMLESARIPGVVVLQAIIHRDGTIGDVTVVRSSNEAFSQSAVAAVKQWRYTPLPYEGLVTVTVNFTVPR